MLQPTSILFGSNLDRAALEASLATTEAINGPLVSLGHTDTKTAATFKLDTVPEKLVELIEVINGKVTVPVDSVEICRGFVFLAGSIKQVIAVRDK